MGRITILDGFTLRTSRIFPPPRPPLLSSNSFGMEPPGAQAPRRCTTLLRNCRPTIRQGPLSTPPRKLLKIFLRRHRRIIQKRGTMYVHSANTMTTTNLVFQALARDNFRCMLTGHIDIESARMIPELRSETRVDHNATKTDCCHILPESFNEVSHQQKRWDNHFLNV